MKILFAFSSLAIASLSSTCLAGVGGYWRFEEGLLGATASGAGSVLDSSGSANHGSPLGDPVYSGDIPSGFPGSNSLSLSFDGSGDVVAIPNSASLGGVGSFTVEFWMRSAGTGAGHDLLVDKSHGFTDSTGWVFQSQPGTGVIFFAVGLGGGSSSNFDGVLSDTDLFDDEWHHLAGIYDGANVEFYVDGLSQGTKNVGTYVGNTRDVRLGNTWQSSRFFDGELDELRISDAVLSSSDFLNVVPELQHYGLMAGFFGMIFIASRRSYSA